MIDTFTTQRKVEAYLDRLRSNLKSLPAAQVSDIVQEIRGHIQDSTTTVGTDREESLTATLDHLGRPEQIAAMYVTQHLIRRAEQSHSPWLIVRSSFRWAALSAMGSLVFVGTGLGYGAAASFVICALAKPFLPDRIGLWRGSASGHLVFALGAVSQANAKDVLGWWLIPIGLCVGVGVSFLTTRFGLWGLGKFRQPNHECD